MIFDGYIMVDWSAASKERIGEGSIWSATLMHDMEEPHLENHPTRTQAYDYLARILTETKEQRLLLGFDFPFGYPFDSYDGFGCNTWAELWDLLSDKIEDKPNNNNNRFKVASDFNESFYSTGKGKPFWGYPETQTYPHLENNPPQGYGDTLPTKFRIVEQELQNHPKINPKPVWKLFNPPDVEEPIVGSQTLMGIPIINKLRKEFDCAVWPFDLINEEPKKQFVLAEIYPSIWRWQGNHPIRDANEVSTVAKNIAQLDKSGELKNLLQAPRQHARKNDITEKEGWILGVDKEGIPAPFGSESARKRIKKSESKS